MPEMSGIELCRRLREQSPALKVLFMSGYSDHAVFRDRSAQDHVNFIQKPFMPQDLAVKVREVLDSPPAADRRRNRAHRTGGQHAGRAVPGQSTTTTPPEASFRHGKTS